MNVDKLNISASGYMVVLRGGTERILACPYKNSPCGDWCPMFDGPHLEEPIVYKDGSGKIYRVDLCQSVIKSPVCEDKRGC